jgi:hypothetical protein
MLKVNLVLLDKFAVLQFAITEDLREVNNFWRYFQFPTGITPHCDVVILNCVRALAIELLSRHLEVLTVARSQTILLQ